VSVQRREERGWHGEAYAELKRRLGQEGIFDTAIKKPIPKYPRAVGVVIPRSTASSNDNRIHAQSVESADTLHDQLARIFALRPRITDDHLHIGIPPM